MRAAPRRSRSVAAGTRSPRRGGNVPALAVERSGGFFEGVYALVASIPPGRVATYGFVAACLGTPRGARAVGWALRALPASLEDRVPWHRVVGFGGRIAQRGFDGAERQRRRLLAEGTRFRGDRVDMSRHDIARVQQAGALLRPVRSRRRR